MAMRRKRRKKQGMQLIRESRRGGRRRKHVRVEKEHYGECNFCDLS